MKKIVGFVFLLAGCGEYRSEPEEIYSLDGVKAIRVETRQPNHPETVLQSTYTVSPQSRLLLRYEKLSQLVEDIDTGEPILYRISVEKAEDLASALANVSLCPLTENWMLLATWEHAHPFGGGKWKDAGGTYDSESCVTPIEASDNSSGRQMDFSLKSWFINYPKGRSQNFGLILRATAPTKIMGDRSGLFSPRIVFKKRPSYVLTVDPPKTEKPTEKPQNRPQ